MKLNPISILKSDEPILNTTHICELLKYKCPKTQSSARCFQNAVNLMMSLTPHHRPEQGDQTPKVSAEKFLHGEMIERKVWWKRCRSIREKQKCRSFKTLKEIHKDRPAAGVRASGGFSTWSQSFRILQHLDSRTQSLEEEWRSSESKLLELQAEASTQSCLEPGALLLRASWRRCFHPPAGLSRTPERICADEEEEGAEQPTKMKSWSSQSELEVIVRAGGHSQSWRSQSDHPGLPLELSKNADAVCVK